MEGKQSRVRFADEDGGRLSTAYRQIVAKMPFLDVKEQEQQRQPEELQEEEEEQKQQEEVEVEEEEHEGSPNLCQRCKELDLDMIFNGPCLDLDEMVLSLGILDKDSPCGLCRFFYSMRRPNLTGETTGFYHLRRYILEQYASSRAWTYRVPYTAWAVDPGWGSQDLEWGGRGLSIQHMIDRPQLLFLPQSTQPYPYQEKTFKGLPISETSVNYSLLRHWIKGCDGHPDCSYLSTDSTSPRTGSVIRGIDCITRNIVDLQPGDKYIALSYVWGNQPLVGNKGSRVLPTNAPKVVEDAMVVVKELGQQYLWVDQYCIDQHNDQDKHAQIKNMDRIYEGSHATIVAFSGVDSSSGLPGVSSIPRTRQHRFTSSKVTLLGFTPSITRQSLDASIWMKRGWTFQEALLSRRLLIFTQEQVYFLCSRGWSAESCAPRRHMIDKPFTPSINAFKSSLPATSMYLISPLTREPVCEFGYQLQVEISDVLDLIERFTRRQLSFQSDALDAVRGLLSRVAVLTYWGIPVIDFVDDLGPLTVIAVFPQCLWWQPDRKATDAEYLGRREGFPSWSWLGWRIPVTFGYYYSFKDLRSPVTVKVEETDGTLLSILDLVELFGAEVERSRMLPERTTYLWLEGLVLTLGFQPVGNRHDGETCFCFNHPLGYSDSTCLMEGSCALDSKDNEVSFRLDVRGSEEIWRTTLAKKWSCLWMYCLDGRHHFLILDEGDDAAYCVGTLLLQDDTEDENPLEKLKAKVPHEYKEVRIG